MYYTFCWMQHQSKEFFFFFSYPISLENSNALFPLIEPWLPKKYQILLKKHTEYQRKFLLTIVFFFFAYYNTVRCGVVFRNILLCAEEVAPNILSSGMDDFV